LGEKKRFHKETDHVKSLLLAATLSIAWWSLGSPALAQEDGPEPATPQATAAAEQADAGDEVVTQEHYLSFFGVAMGVALIIGGAAYGISKIATASVEGMSRQPEVSGNIQMALIITTAMIEGVAFFALIICLLELFQ
jgi:F0F1-type ATP synthase membrane subunit c/vacuolar-type H+-ATPase subunit K